MGVEQEVVTAVRPEDEAGVLLVPQTEDVVGPYSGPYEAGGVWGVFKGSGVANVNGVEVAVDHPGAYELISHERHTEGVLELSVSEEVCCLGVLFHPGPGRRVGRGPAPFGACGPGPSGPAGLGVSAVSRREPVRVWRLVGR